MKTLLAALLLLSVAPDLRAQIPQSEYAARRAAVASGLPDGIVIAFGAQPPAADYLDFFQASNFNYLRAATIYGGSNEIQKNIIAKMILGLPQG